MFNRLEILTLPCEYIFSLMNFTVNNQEHLKLVPLYTVSTQGISISLIDKFPTSYFQKSAYYAGINIFNSLSSSLTSLINKKAQFKVVLKIYLITQFFYCVDEFVMNTITHDVCKGFLVFIYCKWVL
jgi:hypothetical protein